MNPKEMHYETLANTIIQNLAKRKMEGCYCATIEEAEKKAFSYLTEGCTVSFGGSMTLEETGMLTALRHDPNIRLIDRATAKTPEETKQMYHDALSSDFYFMSTNAITVDGELINIDGTGNRVAALIYGPENVIIMAGMNKVAANVDEAISRVHSIATPMNCKRLNKKTPCSATGVCADCLSPDCICNQVVITRRSGIEGRIKVILIGEELGY
ncbi:MAG: lactate utilization protein [Clostridiales bacterium]|nr:lactate utilization protein [Roseburia sp.]MDD7637435.1 lactate utilization protein [Clostridiales bacterium]MDY4113246.1 lactate utilization protein [Roseburia sp.]